MRAWLRQPANRWLLLAALGLLVLVAAGAGRTLARDDGRYADSPLKSWFDGLRSGNGPCCSDADGTALSDVDWDTRDGHYRVRFNGEWLDVPAAALVTEPNRYGRAMVWPFWLEGRPQIRCFMPGMMG